LPRTRLKNPETTASLLNVSESPPFPPLSYHLDPSKAEKRPSKTRNRRGIPLAPAESTPRRLLIFLSFILNPDVASVLNSLAGIMRSQGKLGDTEAIFQQILEIKQAILGKDNPDVASSLLAIADLMRARGKFEEAESIVRQALEIRKKVLGLGHPDVASTLLILTDVLKLQGKFSEVEALVTEAIAIREKVFGKSNPEYLRALESLADFYRRVGKIREAERIDDEVRKARRR
jgi:tetratricopeptide (TPR) repeat protein